MTKDQKIGNRFLVTLLSNTIKSALAFSCGLIIAGELGPEHYGRFSFLLASFVAIRSLLEMGTSSAFFTFASRTTRVRQFYVIYAIWLLIQFIIPILCIFYLFPSDLIVKIWRSEKQDVILLAFVASFMQQTMWNFIAQLGESHRKTTDVQLLNVSVAIFHIIGIIAGSELNLLTIETVYGLIIFEYLLVLVVVGSSWGRTIWLKTSSGRLDKKKLILEYYRYCAPMVPYAWVSFAFTFADTWLLQIFGGSIEQGFYAVGAQIASISLIATTSILRVFWKEIAEAKENNNMAVVKILYRKVSKSLFFIGALIAGILMPWSEEIIIFTLGKSYEPGTLVLTVMFFYPVHQALGQITGSMFYATGKTKQYVFIGILSMVTSILVAYFVMAPKNQTVPGLGLASIGLACKMVVMQIFSVNLSVWVLSRIYHWKFEIGYQIVTLALATGFGYVFSMSAVLILGYWLPPFVVFMLSSFVTAIVMVGFAYFYSDYLLGFSRIEVKQNINKFIGWGKMITNK